MPPLDGLLVADFSRVLAGPLAAMLLGDLGADVIKVERPDGGDDTRAWGPPCTRARARTTSGSTATSARSRSTSTRPTAAVRAGRPDVRGDGRRRRGRRPARRARERAEPRVAARQDPPDRPARRRRPAYQVPRQQPVRGPRGRSGRGLQLRAAQPVALLVRSQDGRPEHRRRRPERVRGDRLRAARRGPRRELRLAPVRGPLALHGRRVGAGGDRAGHRPVARATATARSPAASSSATGR